MRKWPSTSDRTKSILGGYRSMLRRSQDALGRERPLGVTGWRVRRKEATLRWEVKVRRGRMRPTRTSLRIWGKRAKVERRACVPQTARGGLAGPRRAHQDAI